MPQIVFRWPLVSTLPLLFTLCLVGCSGSDPNKGINVKTTVAVTGKVLVDGEIPDSPVQVKAYVQNNDGAKQPESTGGTNKEGVFGLSTYRTGDGLPPGEYKLTFMWGQLSLMGGGMGGPDKLGGQYVDPEKSEFSITVTEDGPTQDLGVFELEKSKAPVALPDDRTRD